MCHSLRLRGLAAVLATVKAAKRVMLRPALCSFGHQSGEREVSPVNSRPAAAGVPLRTLQGWMGHRDYKTAEVDAVFAPDPSHGAVWAERAFGAASYDDKSRPNGRLVARLIGSGDENL